MSPSAGHAVVSAAAAQLVPYPYIYVNDDGTARELHAAERQYLESIFPSSDGSRPYVKRMFYARDGWGSIQGFCRRSKLPRDLLVAPAPATNPNPPMTNADYMVWLREKMKGERVRTTQVPGKAWLLRRLKRWLLFERQD
jgi:hypothetical protein